jgi:hypothetical protein
MDTGTKCDICGLNITISSKLLEASQYDKIISKMKLLENEEQLPVQFKTYRNEQLGDSVNFCAINGASYGIRNKCDYWQLNTGKSTNEYISIHQAKSNYFLAKVAIGVSLASFIVALMGYFKPAKETTTTGNNPLRIEKEIPKNIPDKATNPASEKPKGVSP